VVKVPKEMTHEREKFDSVLQPFTDGVAPLVAAGQLGDLLAQFPYSFKINPPALDHLKRLAGEFAHRDVPINVEFRHTSWYDETVHWR